MVAWLEEGLNEWDKGFIWGISCVFEGSCDFVVEGAGGGVEELVLKKQLSRSSSCAAVQR